LEPERVIDEKLKLTNRISATDQLLLCESDQS